MGYKFGVSTTTSPYTPLGLAFGDGTVWSATTLGGGVYRYDPVTGAVVGNIAIGGDCIDVVYAFGSAWVTHGNFPGFARQNVSRIDPATNTITATITIGSDMNRLAFDGNYVWATQNAGNPYYVRRIDPATNTTTGFYSAGSFPYGINTAAGSVYITQPALGTVLRVDPSTLALQATITTGDVPADLVYAFGDVWVSVQDQAGPSNPTVQRISTSTNTVTASIAVPGTTPDIIRANSTDIYFGDTSRNTWKINPSTNAVEFIIANAGNSGPNGMCIDASNKVWVSTGYLTNRIDADSLGWVRGHAWG
jgi:streptogramin lyase